MHCINTVHFPFFFIPFFSGKASSSLAVFAQSRLFYEPLTPRRLHPAASSSFSSLCMHGKLAVRREDGEDGTGHSQGGEEEKHNHDGRPPTKVERYILCSSSFCSSVLAKYEEGGGASLFSFPLPSTLGPWLLDQTRQSGGPRRMLRRGTDWAANKRLRANTREQKRVLLAHSTKVGCRIGDSIFFVWEKCPLTLR